MFLVELPQVLKFSTNFRRQGQAERTILAPRTDKSNWSRHNRTNQQFVVKYGRPALGIRVDFDVILLQALPVIVGPVT